MSGEPGSSAVQARQQHSSSQPSTEAAQPVSSLLAGYHGQGLHQQALPSHLGQHSTLAPSGQYQALGQQGPLQDRQPGYLPSRPVQQQASHGQLQGSLNQVQGSLDQVQQLHGGDQGSLSNLRQLLGLGEGVQEGSQASAGSYLGVWWSTQTSRLVAQLEGCLPRA